MKSFFRFAITTLTFGTMTVGVLVVGTGDLLAQEKAPAAKNKTLNHDPAAAVANLDVASDLECTLFASEPMLSNPSSIDVDHRGRVWVCELSNYRRFKNNRPKGDRILILEDTNHDGRADNQKVFYQGTDINAPHGVCVIAKPDGQGTIAIVSTGSRIVKLIDDDGDDKADRQQNLFTGIEGVQHDHGIHAVMFGPDGRLYFNFGNYGTKLLDADGNPVRDRAGRLVIDDHKPYGEGMAFRCNLDGTDVETLGWNFRNPWMVTVDSFGNVWQSDNDDDGNRGVRINFLLEFGNYGYRNELNGSDWRVFRTGWHDEIPSRHWHLNDPGVVPNLLQTGGGSPTGITVYEGDLLPKRYQGQLLHCDSGPSVVRCYHVKVDGAGYQAESSDLLNGVRNQWFRPTDVKVAPDGSLFVSDWYDPGVGGHGMGDATRGRIFRVTPQGGGSAYQVTKQDFSTPAASVEALASPNLATRAMAWQQLAQFGLKAEAALRQMWQSDNARLRARALWLLGNQKEIRKKYLHEAWMDSNPQLRIIALRIARRHQCDVLSVIERLIDDPSPQVRREVAIALAQLDSPRKPALWAKLASQYEGSDRWMLEALGIAARGRWDACLSEWLEVVGKGWSSPAGRDLVWRSRARQTPELLAKLIIQASRENESATRYFRAFDFQQQPLTIEPLTGLVRHTPLLPSASLAEAFARLPDLDVHASSAVTKALKHCLAEQKNTHRYHQLIRQYQLKEYCNELLQTIVSHQGQTSAAQAIETLVLLGEAKRILPAINGKENTVVENTLLALGKIDHQQGNLLLQNLMRNADQDLSTRVAAARGLGQSGSGQKMLFQEAKAGQIEDGLRFTIATALHSAADQNIRKQAAQLLPLPATVGKQPLLPLEELINLQGDIENGQQVYAKTGTCIKCHRITPAGKSIGPDLNEIGSKLTREAMFRSILDPSASISHNYEQYIAELDSGTVEAGLLINETDALITLRNVEGVDKTISRDEIESLQKSELSLMPANLQTQLTQQQLVDLVEFLLTLKKQ
ncbi:MAG: c-type cytochrome [Planctomycetes bacterium]|nr:c-type cytochrome [Planctomycetota bacterium]